MTTATTVNYHKEKASRQFETNDTFSDHPVFRVMSTREDNNEIYRVHKLPAHDQWLCMFSFTTGQSRRKENNTMFFIYPPSSRFGKSIISSALYINDSDRFPNDFFIAGRNEITTDILEFITNSSMSNKITVSNQSTDCCYSARTNIIPVILLPGKLALAIMCLAFVYDFSVCDMPAVRYV